MALRDTWHRTLVYFGLAEEEDPRYESVVNEPEPEAELEDRYRDRPNVRRLQRRRRDEFDDIFAEEPRGGGRETRVLRPVGGNGRSGGNGDGIQVHRERKQKAETYRLTSPLIVDSLVITGAMIQFAIKMAKFAQSVDALEAAPPVQVKWSKSPFFEFRAGGNPLTCGSLHESS